MAESTLEKGARLARDGKVGEPIPAVVWPVEGDHGTYEVTVREDDQVRCSCPATGPCAHIYAAARTRAFLSGNV
jgi:uncharacterized Zn finger protein